jgi:hypothetical protein
VRVVTGASITRRAVCVCLFFATLSQPPAPAADAPAPFSYTWRIVFRGKEIGHAVSRFSYRDVNGEPLLVETGNREFTADLGVITVDYAEETSVVWDRSGLMKTYVSRSSVRGRDTCRRAERRTDGSVGWRSDSEGKVRERTFAPGEFDFTDGDRFIPRLGDGTGPRTLRILSLGRGKVVSLTYRFVGREVIGVGDSKVEVLRVEVEGTGGKATLLIDDLGIAVEFTMDALFGDFSFIPTSRQ